MVNQVFAGWALAAASILFLAASGDWLWLAIVIPLAAAVAVTVVYMQRKNGDSRARKELA